MRSLRSILTVVIVGGFLLVPGIASAAPSADLKVTVTGSPHPVVIYWNITYKIVVRNLGPSTATGVKLSDTYGSDASYVSVWISQGSCPNTGGGQVKCQIGTLAAGRVVYATVVLKNWGGDGGYNWVEVTSTTKDPVIANNKVFTKIKIIDGPPPPSGSSGASHTPAATPTGSPHPSGSTSATATESASVTASPTPFPTAPGGRSPAVWIGTGLAVLLGSGAAGFALWRRRR
jgi:uncharacterized repeat protein (TIGR01451 family)